ncbi:MAG: LysR family transcriptional regulator [Lachnospiraceae bacterium]|nr:LysR family transcriptional regulator [Lachnospiraceae bacterium]
MDVNYELYKVFYHVAKTLSFSEAAASLFISQSAVSQSVKVLERRLGQVLFTRSTKRVSLTPEGELLFKHIEPAINLITKGENQLVNSKDTGGTQLRIAASDTICRYYLVPYLNRFHQTFPDVHLKVMNATSLQCAQLLSENAADLIVANSPNPALNHSMQIETLKEFSDIFIANKTSYDYSGAELSFAELSTLPILMLSKHSTTSEFLHEQFLYHSVELAPAVELSSNDLLIDLAKIGLGIAFVPDFCVEGKTGDELYIIKTKEQLPKRKLVLAYDGSLPVSGPTEYFLNLLRDGT